MIGLYVQVPVACFRKGTARDFWETEPVPPPATCYGFLLALVGEEDRDRHRGVRVSPGLLANPDVSQVLRTAWRVKDRKKGAGQGNNASPIEQQLLTGIELVIWLDAAEDSASPNLEARVRHALADPTSVKRYGGLCLGESTHLVNVVRLLDPNAAHNQRLFVMQERGRLSLPVLVDHVGSIGTRYAVGDLVKVPLVAPEPGDLPQIPPAEPGPAN